MSANCTRIMDRYIFKVLLLYLNFRYKIEIYITEYFKIMGTSE